MTDGQEAHRYNISAISSANPCVVTTSAANDFVTGNFVRIMDLDGSMPIPRGSDQIDGNRYLIEVVDTTNFKLKDAITHEYISSIGYAPYVSGGNVNYVEQVFYYN